VKETKAMHGIGQAYTEGIIKALEGDSKEQVISFTKLVASFCDEVKKRRLAMVVLQCRHIVPCLEEQSDIQGNKTRQVTITDSFIALNMVMFSIFRRKICSDFLDHKNVYARMQEETVSLDYVFFNVTT
jgi:hypothetical protein